MDASSHVPLEETSPQCRYLLGHRDAAFAATENMAPNTHSQNVHKTGCSNDRKQYAMRCESLHSEVEGGQLTIAYTAEVHIELCDQFNAARKGKPLWLTKAFLNRVCKIKHHDVVSSAMFVDEFRDTDFREWPKQALNSLDEAAGSYMVKVIAESSF
jgi:hypothetical protein